jgi:glycosyltransferase involved in cell wall biosynthesis
LSHSDIPSRTANSVHVMKMCQAFAKNGHRVTLITHNRKERLELGVQDHFAFYGVECNFKLLKSPWLPIKGRANLAELVAAVRAKVVGTDLIYGRALRECYFASRLGLPVVFEAHRPIEDRGLKARKAFARLIRRKNFLRLVVISDALRLHYLDACPALVDRIVVAPDAADPVELTCQSTGKQADGRLQVGYVGNLYPGKGMEIIAKLAPICQWAEFNVIGGNEEDLEVWKRALRDVSNVVFHGYLPHSEAIRTSRRFDVMVAPYQEQVKGSGRGDLARWMSPLKIFEYMSLAKPIISSNLSVLQEVLQHERNALMVAPNNVEEWAGALQCLRDAPSLRAELGQCAKKDFLAKYTWTKRAELVLQGLPWASARIFDWD